MNNPQSYLPMRRDDIKTLRNNRLDLDYVIIRREVMAGLSIAGAPPVKANLLLHYVPDRYVLTLTDGLSLYLQDLRVEDWCSLEDLALAILDDLNNQLVPRWLRTDIDLNGQHGVVLEDNKPNWNNEGLLSRLSLKG